ncbi:hypothetical protein R5R35_006942 [Gryllus longicercus]|uniref:Prostaglandin reductase 1 n=1 Tax=Gryllus longicercus TaxID=2509291 RepID=A0AAN9YU25_9ORTH
MVKAKKIVLASRFDGEPKLSDFKVVEEDLPPLQDGQVLCETLWLSVDPYMRIYTQGAEAGTLMPGGVVARIVESKAPEYPRGRFLVGYWGWRTKSVWDPRQPPAAPYPQPYLLPDFGELPLSLGVGALGMPGVTANLGLLEVCAPRAGETVVVNAAAGAVGSLVGQLARIRGCRVVGFAGSDRKVAWLKERLGFDAAFNYKKVAVGDALAQAAPHGVHCYFDNVGGAFSHEVHQRMVTGGRVVVVGAIAGYNDGFDSVLVPMPQPVILLKELKVQGFVVWSHAHRWLEAIQQNLQWIKEGKLLFEETVTEGFENAPQAFIGMMRGESTGKAVVKV